METYLEADLEQLFKHLFLSFMRKPGSPTHPSNRAAGGATSSLGKDLSHVTTTACVPIVGDPPVDHGAGGGSSSIGRNLGGSIAEKLHGLSERIHNLGHSRHDSTESGKRSRAGRVYSTHTRTLHAYMHSAHNYTSLHMPDPVVCNCTVSTCMHARNTHCHTHAPFTLRHTCAKHHGCMHTFTHA